MCFFAALAYSIIIGDSFSSIAASFNLPAVFAHRTNLILLLTTFVLFPLCSLKSLSALAPFSLLGLLGTSYTAVFMAIRYFDGSYAPGGAFFKTLSATFTPKFGSKAAVSTKAFVLLSMLSSAYVAHYNAPQFYSELKNTSVSKFAGVVNVAFGFSVVKYAFMTAIGFLTFGGASSGFVLNNYASTDGLTSIARLAIGIALITSYPFTFAALRNGIMDLGKFSAEKRAKWTRPLTVGLLALLTGLAIILKDVGFVVSIAGAVFGNAIMFVIPAIMSLSNSKKPTVSKAGVQLGRMSQVEASFNKFMVVTGIFMAVVGAVISILLQIGVL